MPRRVLAPSAATFQTGGKKRKPQKIDMGKVERDLFMEFSDSSSSSPSYGAPDYSDEDLSPDTAYDNIQVRINILDSRDEVLARRIKNLEHMVLTLRSELNNLRNG